jgi:hypothetical protein
VIVGSAQTSGEASPDEGLERANRSKKRTVMILHHSLSSPFDLAFERPSLRLCHAPGAPGLQYLELVSSVRCHCRLRPQICKPVTFVATLACAVLAALAIVLDWWRMIGLDAARQAESPSLNAAGGTTTEA